MNNELLERKIKLLEEIITLKNLKDDCYHDDPFTDAPDYYRNQRKEYSNEIEMKEKEINLINKRIKNG